MIKSFIMENMQSRFYNIMICYMDDERIAAHAICHYSKIKETPETIYIDLLKCKYKRWVYRLENIADEVSWLELKEFCGTVEARLDMMNSNFWSCGDWALIEKAAWKLDK